MDAASAKCATESATESATERPVCGMSLTGKISGAMTSADRCEVGQTCDPTQKDNAWNELYGNYLCCSRVTKRVMKGDQDPATKPTCAFSYSVGDSCNPADPLTDATQCCSKTQNKIVRGEQQAGTSSSQCKKLHTGDACVPCEETSDGRCSNSNAYTKKELKH